MLVVGGNYCDGKIAPLLVAPRSQDLLEVLYQSCDQDGLLMEWSCDLGGLLLEWSCDQCSSYWSGLVTWVSSYLIGLVPLIPNSWLSVYCMGEYTCQVNFLGR